MLNGKKLAMSILIKEHICECGRKSKGYKQCAVCRQKKYAEKTANKKNEKAEQEDNSDLVEYFKYHIDFIKKNECRCMECNATLKNVVSAWNIAHILPKSNFKSVRSVKENCIYLCRNCHGQFDSSFTNAKKMKVWNHAKKIALSLLHLVKEKHKILEQYKN